mgnify:CR=1 FL=1
MKKFALTILTFLSVVSLSFSQTNFADANRLYSEGNYADAIAAYEYLLQDNKSAELYYNLGNAYFKMGELGQSILAYERALYIKPYYKDARYNLRFAQSRIVDNIEDNHSFFLSQWITALRNTLNENQWLLISICMFVIALCSFFLFAFSRNIPARKTGFHLAWITLLISIFSFFFALSLHHRDVKKEEAIVMQGIVNAKASPDQSGTDLFTLHEGTKVYVRSSLGDWVEITVGNNRGWVKQTTIERIL